MDNYGELKTELALWLNREDLSARIPFFIRSAEDIIYRTLRTEDNEFVWSCDNANWRIAGHSDVNVSDNIHTVLPSNFREMKLVTWKGVPLEHVSQQMLELFLANLSHTKPEVFAITGREISFSKEPDADPTQWASDEILTYTYYGTESLDSMPTHQIATNPVENPEDEDVSPESLTQGDTNTTRMFQKHPFLFLMGSQYIASVYLKDQGAVGLHKQLFNDELISINQEAKRARHSGSSSQVRNAYGD